SLGVVLPLDGTARSGVRPDQLRDQRVESPGRTLEWPSGWSQHPPGRRSGTVAFREDRAEVAAGAAHGRRWRRGGRILMNGSIVERDRRAPAGGIFAKTLLLAAFAVSTFLAGRIWSLREVREAQRAAGHAENERLALQDE